MANNNSNASTPVRKQPEPSPRKVVTPARTSGGDPAQSVLQPVLLPMPGAKIDAGLAAIMKGTCVYAEVRLSGSKYEWGLVIISPLALLM